MLIRRENDLRVDWRELKLLEKGSSEKGSETRRVCCDGCDWEVPCAWGKAPGAVGCTVRIEGPIVLFTKCKLKEAKIKKW